MKKIILNLLIICSLFLSSCNIINNKKEDLSNLSQKENIINNLKENWYSISERQDSKDVYVFNINNEDNFNHTIFISEIIVTSSAYSLPEDEKSKEKFIEYIRYINESSPIYPKIILDIEKNQFIFNKIYYWVYEDKNFINFLSKLENDIIDFFNEAEKN